jgi:hypothetical protein
MGLPIPLKDYLQLINECKRMTEDMWIGLNLVRGERLFSI